MGILDTFKSDSDRFGERLARFERVSPLFDEAKEAFSLLEKDYQEFVTDDLRDLFGRVGKKVEDERWYVGTYQPKGEEISLPESLGSRSVEETSPLNPPLVRGEILPAGNAGADAGRGFLGQAVDMVMNGALGARQGFSDIMGASSRSLQGVSGALGTLVGETTKDSPFGVSAVGRGLGMLSDEFGKAGEQWERYGTDPEQYPEGFSRTMAKIAKGVNEAVGHVVIDIPVIMATPGGLTAYSGGMAAAGGLQEGEKGFELAKTTGKGALHGALLHGVLKGLGYLPKGSQVAGGAAVFGSPAVFDELAKPAEKRDYSYMFTELLTGAGLMAFGKPGKSHKEILRDAREFYGREKFKKAEEQFKGFVENAEKTGEGVGEGKEKINFDEMVREESEIMNLVEEINRHAQKTKKTEGERVREAEKKVPGGRVLRGKGEGVGEKGLQPEYGQPKADKDRLAGIDRERIEFDRMSSGEKKFVEQYLKYRDEKSRALPAHEVTFEEHVDKQVKAKIEKKRTYQGKNRIELGQDERVMFEGEFGNLKVGKVVPGGLREVEHGPMDKEVVGRFAATSTNPEWYRESGVLQGYGKKRILPVMNKVLKEIPLTDKQVEIYNDVRRALDDYAYKVINDYMPITTPLSPPLVRGETRKAEFDEAVRPAKIDDAVGKDVDFDFGANVEKQVQAKVKVEEKQVETSPSEAQKEVGNYKKGHVSVQGFDITIENPKGSTRSGVDESGRKWMQKMNNTYGYFKRSMGKDGDQIDVFLGDRLDSDKVFIVDQVNPKTGKFDEHKVMMGFESVAEAQKNYLANYEKGWKGLGGVVETDVASFKKWVGDGTRKGKAAAEYGEFRLTEKHPPVSPFKGGIKVEKTEAGDQVSFKPAAEMPRGKKMPKPGQKRVEGQEGGLFETERPKGKQGRMFEERGGYKKGIDRGYEPDKVSLFEMPEIVEFMQKVQRGDFPKIYKDMRALGGALPGKMATRLRADIFIGNRLSRGVFKDKFEISDKVRAEFAEKYNVNEKDLRFKWDYKNNRHVLSVYEADPSLAAEIAGHEIGHIVDFIPNETMKRGNILGHMASLKRYMKTLLEEYEGAPGKVLTPQDRARIRKEARKLTGKEKEIWIDKEIRQELNPISPKDILSIWNDVAGSIKEPELNRYLAGLSSAEKKSAVKEALKGRIPEWFGFKKRVKIVIEKVLTKVPITNREQAVREKYRELIKDEIIKRRLFERDVIMDELKKITQVWKPFDVKTDPKYTKYRHSSVELYADAFSMLMNNPGMLKETAPSFYKAFFNYFERKPEVKKVWDEIQTRVKGGSEAVYGEREGRIREMFEHEQEIIKEQNKPVGLRKKLKSGLLDLKKIMVDQEAHLYHKIDKTAKKVDPDNNPRYWIEELPYISTKVYQLLRDVENNFLKSMEKHGLTREDMGELMFLKRVKGERAEFANPLGFTEKAATKQMQYMKRKLGDKKYSALVNFAEDFRALRERSVIPLIEDANMVGKDLLDTIKNTKEYATFDVLKYMEKRYGKGIGGKIYRQIGTLQEIGNPFMATIMKDVALIRAAERKKIAKKFVDFMEKNLGKDIKAADTRIEKDKDGNVRRVPAEPGDPDLGLIVFPEGGKLQGWYVEKEIAETFNRDPYEAGIIYNAWQNIQAPFRALFVSKNPPWSAWNVQRDVRGSATKLPLPEKKYSGVKNLFDFKRRSAFLRMVKHSIKSMPDAYKDVFKKHSTEIVREMYEEKMLLIGRHYRTKYTLDPETDFDLMMQSFSLNGPKYNNLLVKNATGFLNALEKPGQFTERLVKIASYKMLKQTHPDMSIKKKGHLVRTRGGSPDFYRRGTGYRFYNNILLFSNAGKEGWRSSFEASRENKTEFAWKTIKYDMIPKMMMWTAAIGGITALGKHLGDDGIEAQGKWLEDAFKLIPEHDKTNYLCVPLGYTKNNKIVYAVFPHDFTGQVIAGVYWKLLNQNKTKDIEGLIDFAAGGMPYQSLTPPLSIALDWYNYIRGRNPNDPWMNRKMIEETKWDAGGMIRFSEMMKQTWNRYGGRTLYSFPYDDLDRVKSDLEKVMDKPGASGIIRRFIRVSDRGMYDEMIKSGDIKKEEQTAARASLKRREVIISHLNKGVITSRADAAHLWKSLKGTGVDVGSFGTFFNQYVKYVGRKKGDVIFNILSAAQTNKKRRIVLEKMLGRSVDVREVPGIWKRLKYEVLKK